MLELKLPQIDSSKTQQKNIIAAYLFFTLMFKSLNPAPIIYINKKFTNVYPRSSPYMLIVLSPFLAPVVLFITSTIVGQNEKRKIHNPKNFIISFLFSLFNIKLTYGEIK